MEKISDVEKSISLNRELLAATKERLRQTVSKLTESKDNAKRIESGIEDLKEKRRQALVKGGDAKGLTDALKKLESEAELTAETITGLEDFLKELHVEENTLTLESSELPKRILQLKSVELGQRYNELSGQLAEVARGLNAIHFEIDRSGHNGKSNRVVFLPEDFISSAPCAFFDSEALTLENYVAKYPGRYHSNIHCPKEDKFFYEWEGHKQDLINKKAG